MRHELLVTIGQTIARHRKANGLSQDRLAVLAEVDRSYLARLERGQNNVAYLTLARIAAALRVQPADLIAAAQLELDSDDPAERVARLPRSRPRRAGRAQPPGESD